MKIRSVASIFIILAILFVMGVGAEVFTHEFARPTSLFNYIAVTSFVFGLFATIIVEKVDARVLE